jgi:CcmD family protein
MRHLFKILIFSLLPNILLAQRPDKDIPIMSDAMRADGRIYVVVAVVATIFAGIIVYLINLDSKISKLEKQIRK